MSTPDGPIPAIPGRPWAEFFYWRTVFKATAMPSYDLTPRRVPAVRTKYRTIVTEIPVPESIPLLLQLRRYEPLSMSGQPMVVWDRAEGIQVFDRWGNMWLDWSSAYSLPTPGTIIRGSSKRFSSKSSTA